MKEAAMLSAKWQLEAYKTIVPGKTTDADVALIELKEPIEFRSNAVPVCLPEETGGDFLGKMATVVGWGRLTEFGESSTNLQKVQVKIIKNDLSHSISGCCAERSRQPLCHCVLGSLFDVLQFNY